MDDLTGSLGERVHLKESISNVPVKHGGREVGRAVIDTDGVIHIKLSDNLNAQYIMETFKLNFANGLSLDVDHVPAVERKSDGTE